MEEPARQRAAVLLGAVAVVGLALALGLRVAAGKWRSESAALAARSEGIAKLKAELSLQADARKLEVVAALARRQARADGTLHLSIAVDSGTARLEAGEALLHASAVVVGAVGWQRVGADSVARPLPRGVRAVERVEGDTLVVLSDGTGLWRLAADARPPAGALGLRVADFRAVVPNLKPGVPVYLY